MKKNILVMGSWDTKTEELSYLAEKIREAGAEPLLMDTSMGREAGLSVDVTSAAVAEAAGEKIVEIRASRDTRRSTDRMTEGASRIVLSLFADGRLDGVIAIGGASNTGLSTTVMGVLPFGVPKVMVSSMAAVPAYAGSYFGTNDITMFHSVVDIAGLNPLLRNVITRAAFAVCAMAERSKALTLASEGGAARVAMTEFKFSEACSRRAAEVLTNAGCEVICFHAQGLGDRAMEKLISQGLVDAVLDIVPAGLAEEMLGGNRAAGPARLKAAAMMGVPQLLTPCGFDMLSCGPLERRERGDHLWDSRKLAERKLFIPDALRVQARTTAQELREIAEVVSGRLLAARGPWTFMIPKGGWSSLSEPGGPLEDQAADRAFLEAMRAGIGATGNLLEIDGALNTPAFGEAAAAELLRMMNAISGAKATANG